MLIFTLAIRSNSQFHAALSEVRKHSDVRYGMLRVASSETSGRIFIVDGAFIIGCELSDGRKGPIALATLLSLDKAIVGFLEMPRRTGGGGVAVNIESLLADYERAEEHDTVGNVLRVVLNLPTVPPSDTTGEGTKQPAPHSLMMHVIHNQVRKELGPARDATSSGAASTLTEIVLRNLDTYNKLLQRLDRPPDKNFISRSELLCADIAMFESLLEASHRNTYAAQSVKRLRQTLLKLIKRARAQPSDYESTAAHTPPAATPFPPAEESGEDKEEEPVSAAGLFNNLASTLQHDIQALPDSEAEARRQEAERQQEVASAASAKSSNTVPTTDTGSMRVFATDSDFGGEGSLTSGAGLAGGLYTSDEWEYGSDDPFDWGESLFLSEDELAASAEVEEPEEDPDHSYMLEPSLPGQEGTHSDNGDAGKSAAAAISAPTSQPALEALGSATSAQSSSGTPPPAPAAAAQFSAAPPPAPPAAAPTGGSSSSAIPPAPAGGSSSSSSAIPPAPAGGSSSSSSAIPPAPAGDNSAGVGTTTGSTEIPDSLRYPHAGLSGGLTHEHDNAPREKITDSTFRRDLKHTDSMAKRRVEKHAKSQESQKFVIGIAALVGLAVGGYFVYANYLAPPSAKQLYERALASEQQKFFLRAREDADKVIEQDPTYAAAYMLRARLRMNNGEFAEALSDYNQAIKLGVTDDEAMKGRAEAAFKASAWQDAQTALLALLEKTPDDLDLHQKLATTYMRSGQPKEAVEHYTRAITGGAAEPAFIYRDRGLAYEALKDNPKALADYSQALKLNSADLTAYARRGSLYLKNGDVNAAFADLTKATEKTPSPEALLDLAGIYAKKGDHARASELSTKALDLNRKNVRALLTRANSYLALKAYPRALDDLDEALQLDPGNAAIRSQRDKAMAAYRAASPSAVRDLDSPGEEPKKKLPPIPKDMPESSLILQGYEQLRNGHADAAVQMLTEALNKEPSNVEARRYLAHALFRAHHAKESAEQFRSVSATAELSEADQLVFGDALSGSGQTAEAVDILKAVVAAKPSGVAARVSLAKCLIKAGDKEQAKQVVNDGLQLTTNPAEKRELNAVFTSPTAPSPKPDAGQSKDADTNSWPTPGQPQR